MTPKSYREDRDVAVDTAFQPQNSLRWTVRENVELQDELNRNMKDAQDLTSGVVNRVVDRIKDL